eukprot:EG_transcript_13389
MIDDRAADYKRVDVFSLIADNSWNAGLVLGEFKTTWPALENATGVERRDGVQVNSGSGRDVLGHPFAPLVWLANHLARRGIGLRAGDVVTTGSITPTRFPHEAETCCWGVEGLGFVELNVK